MNDLSTVLPVAACLHPIAVAALGVLLLGYPARVAQPHPVIQILICASLTMFGTSAAISFALCRSDFCSTCHQWVLFLAVALSTVTIVVPAIGAIIGLGLAFGLLAQAIYPNVYLVAVASMCGISAIFVYRDLLLYWQLFVPPIVGGYLVALAAQYFVPMNGVQYAIWLGGAVVSLALHIRRRRANTWLEMKQNEALYSEESQIVQVMRHSQPTMSLEDFEKMKTRLLEVVQGDTEQADRIVYGGGLY